ncbi:MAG: lipocalin family protein [Bacteroidota bacterium]
MKKLIFRLLVISPLLFMSCPEDDDGVTDENSDLIGTWQLTAWNSDTAYDIDGDGTASINLLDEIDCLAFETLIFNNDNSAEVNTTSSLEIEIELEDGDVNDFTLDVSCEFENDSFILTWTRNGNEITLIEDDFVDESLVANLSGNTLTFSSTENIEVLDGEFELEVPLEFSIVYTKL